MVYNAPLLFQIYYIELIQDLQYFQEVQEITNITQNLVCINVHNAQADDLAAVYVIVKYFIMLLFLLLEGLKPNQVKLDIQLNRNYVCPNGLILREKILNRGVAIINPCKGNSLSFEQQIETPEQNINIYT